MLQKISLSNFRNFKSKEFSFSPGTTVVVGPNASGKTNLLESIYLVATGKSFRVRIEEEMINLGSELARASGVVKLEEEEIRLEVVLTRGVIGERQEKVARKKLLVNSVPRRLFDYIGNFRAVVFGPSDLGLVTDSPSLRRRFLDSAISQVDREYARASLSYEKGLRNRNRVLLRIRDEGFSRSQLLFWDRLLIKNGDYISQKREEFIEFVNRSGPINDQEFSLEYDRSAISEGRLSDYAEEEVAAAVTLVGPHRDDVIFNIKYQKANIKNGERNLAIYGSRGEQRMAVLWLKLAELSYIGEKTGSKPTLLLDDIFSELDHEHRKVVMDIVAKHQAPLRASFAGVATKAEQDFAGQAIITTAEAHFVRDFEKVEKIRLPELK